MANSIQVPVVQTGLGQSINSAVRQVGTINVPININPAAFQNLAQPLGKITGLATEFEKSIAASNARVLAFGASVGIINGVQNALSALVKSGIEVQKTLTEIGAISGQSGDQLKKFGDDIFSAAKNTGNSFKIASEAALEFSRQGLSAEETIKRTNDALTLSRFTNLSAAESVDTLTAALNTFQNAGLTSAQVINKLVAVDAKFAVSAEDLAKGIARSGSIAQEVGVSFDELGAAITVAQERTARGGSVIGNALKTIFTNIRSDNTVEALRSVGVESLTAQGNLKGAIPLLQELSEKMKDMSGGEKIQILETIASKYNINILSAILGDLKDANSKFGQAVRVSTGAGNEAYERLAIVSKTLSSDINKATQSLAQFYAKLSEIGVTEGLSNILKFVNTLLDGLNKLLDSEGVGGNIARGLIKGLSDIFFTVGLPIIAAIFIKLTSDIAKFGVESLKTILGINQQVRERVALEQAVVNTLIKDQQIMASILAMGGDRARQEQYLLGIYQAQITALQTVKNIGSAVAPGLMGAGLSATSGSVTRRSAGGYLPAQEASDVRRGVGGANSSAKVVSIPNFAFGGGQKGTMVANSSEYVVPNFANGGSAIFNQDMVKSFGLPAGAKKINAASGFVPNFAKYVYDSDKIPADKNATLKAILASAVKKNLIIGPSGSGKTTLATGMGQFLTGAADVVKASEIDILSGAGRSKDGGLSKNFESIMDAVNNSGGQVSYLYTKNFDILSRRSGRTEATEGDLRSKKQLAGTAYAPLNQFDFMGMVKSKARNFNIVRGSKGFIPNFAETSKTNEPIPEGNFIKYAALFADASGQKIDINNLGANRKSGVVPNKAYVNPLTGKAGAQSDTNNQKILVNSYGFGNNPGVGKAQDVKSDVEAISKKLAKDYAVQFAKLFRPNHPVNLAAVEQRAGDANQNKGAIQGFIGSIFEAGVAGILSPENFKENQGRSTGSLFDFNNTPELQQAFGISENALFVETKNSPSARNIEKVAEKIFKVEGGKAAIANRKPMIRNPARADGQSVARAYPSGMGWMIETGSPGNFVPTSADPKSERYEMLLKPPPIKKGSGGYIPNFANPLGDAVQREMAAGLSPNQISITQDGRLRNAGNPGGLAVINSRDEPNGKVPNFAGSNDPANIRRRTATAVEAGRASYITSRPETPTATDDKFALTTNKLMAGFIGLQIATSTLQSTFKQTDSVVGKALAAISQIGSSVAGGGIIGGMAGDALKGKGGMLGKIGGYLGPAGMIAGAGIGIYNAVQESRAAETAGYKQEGKSAAELKLRSIDTSSANEQEAIQKKREEVSISAKAVQSLRLEKQAAQDRENETKSSLTTGVSALADQISPFASNVGAQLGFDPAITKALENKTTLQAALQTQQAAYEDAGVRRAKEKITAEATFTSELKERVALATQINSIEIAASNGFVKTQKDRTDAQVEFIKNASLYTQAQRDQIQDQLVLKEIEHKRLDAQQGILNDALKQVADKKLATVSEAKLKGLIAQLEAGKEIEDITKSITDLDVNGLNTLKEILLTAKKRTIENDNAAKSSAYDTKEKTKGLRIDQERVKLAEIYAKGLESQLDFSRSMEDIRTAGTQSKEDLLAQKDVTEIQNQISKKPFASATDERRLAEANATLATLTETRNIQRAYDNETKQANRARQDSYTKAASSLTMLGAEEVKILDTLIKTNKLEEARAYMNQQGYAAWARNPSAVTAQQLDQSNTTLNDAEKKLSEQLAIQKEYRDIALKQLKEQITYTVELARLREKSPAKAGMFRATSEIGKEISDFRETFSYNTTLGFRDGLRDAMSAAISQTDDLGAALQNVATGFLKTMQTALLNRAANDIIQFVLPGKAAGGLITGGSGYKDDVPAMLTGGEFVLTKSAVQKYGVGNLAKMNTGGTFLPGVRGGGDISGVEALRAFANQTTTSGATDITRGTGSSAYLSLEDQSSKLSRFGLLNEDTIKGEITSAQQQGLDLVARRDAERTQKRKAMQQQVVGTILSAVMAYGTSKIPKSKGLTFNSLGKVDGPSAGISGLMPTGSLSLGQMGGGLTNTPIAASPPRGAYGGMVRRYASGGPTDDTPAMLMSGEYVMNRGASRKYGTSFLNSMNSGRAPRFADGGAVDAAAADSNASSKKTAMNGDINISINVASNGSSETKTQGEDKGGGGGIDYKKMSEKIKAIVVETIQEEKRLGGSLRK